MDERHEELKGARGWTTRNRRSVSWLLYLSDDGWDDEKWSVKAEPPAEEVEERVAENHVAAGVVTLGRWRRAVESRHVGGARL